MNTAFIALVVIAIALLVLSFFLKDRVKELESQMDQMSLNIMQDMYKMKKKMKVLEEELLVTDDDYHPIKMSESKREKVTDLDTEGMNDLERMTYFQQNGMTVEEIARKTSLPVEEVSLRLNQSRKGTIR